MKAAKKGDREKIIQLLKAHADINARNKKGFTALALASRKGDLGIVQLLLRAGAEVNTADSESGITPLESAVMGGHVEIAKALLDAGANVNARDTYRGRTPLHWVVRMTEGSVKKIAAQIPVKKSMQLLELLLARGADRTLVDNEGKTALQWAKFMKHNQLVQILSQKLPPKRLAYLWHRELWDELDMCFA